MDCLCPDALPYLKITRVVLTLSTSRDQSSGVPAHGAPFSFQTKASPTSPLDQEVCSRPQVQSHECWTVLWSSPMSGHTHHLFKAKQCVLQPALCMDSKSSIFLTFLVCFFLKSLYSSLATIQPCQLSHCDPVIPVRWYQAISFLHLQTAGAFFRFLWDFLPQSLRFQILGVSAAF